MPRLRLLVAVWLASVLCCGRTSGIGRIDGVGGSTGGISAAGGGTAGATVPDATVVTGGAQGPFSDAGIAGKAETCDSTGNDDAPEPADGESGLAGDVAADRWNREAMDAAAPADVQTGLPGDMAPDRWDRDAAAPIDGCQPITCTSSPCGVAYCGLVSDGCGGTLDCGSPCSARQRCIAGKCLWDGDCRPLTCELWGSYHYCGPIGDGCGYDLDCGCPAGWTCENHFCVGRPPVCTPKTCADFAGCGWQDDGCGTAILCTTCPKPDWICDLATGRCIGPPSICTPWTSCTSATGDVFCGTIGDTCGGALQCGDTCASLGTRCEDNVCGGGPNKPPVAPPPPSGQRDAPPPPPPPRCGPPMPPA